MMHHVVPEAEVAQAAATLAAGALSAVDHGKIPDSERLGDYALDLFWHIYEAMRVGVEVDEIVPPPEL